MRRNFVIMKNGKEVSNMIMDMVIAKFWGKKYENELFANPFEDDSIPENATFRERMRIKTNNAMHNSFNWYDVLGSAIENQGLVYKPNTWRNVVHTMIATSLGEELLTLNSNTIELAQFVGNEEMHLEDKYEIKLFAFIKMYNPYIELVKYLDSEGYIPVKLEE